jgi:hypothetical protein
MSNAGERKIIAILVIGDVEMKIKGKPDDVRSFVHEHVFPDYVQALLIEDIDWRVNNQQEGE